MATTVDLHHVATALGVTVMIIAIEVLAVTTMMIAVIDRLHVAAQWTSMVPRLEDVTKTHTDGIMHRLIRMSMAVLMTVHLEISHHEKAVMGRVKGSLARIIGEEATGKHLS